MAANRLMARREQHACATACGKQWHTPWNRQWSFREGDENKTMDEEPLILAFCCHYCAYAAADLAGSMRLQYPDNVRVLRLPCTGKLEVNYLMAAFERGVDGVIVAGCLEGGCHYLEGNLRARKRVERARQLLREIGLEPERLEMFNLSSAEGTRFAEIVTTMVQRLKQLGASPLRPDAARLQQGVHEMSRQAEAMLAGDKR
jgi:F420-non-reducing hydrogenase iron-sulfur subunit